MTARSDIVWARGGHAEVLSVEDDAITLRSTTPAPPGARIEGTLAGEVAAAIKIKSHGSHKEEDGNFTIKGRLLDAPRGLRDRVGNLVRVDEAASPAALPRS